MGRPGYRDFLYVHHDFQRRGIASKLNAEAERAMRSSTVRRIHTQASITAQSFFLRQDFRIVKRQWVEVRAVELPNVVMEKLPN